MASTEKTQKIIEKNTSAETLKHKGSRQLWRDLFVATAYIAKCEQRSLSLMMKYKR